MPSTIDMAARFSAVIALQQDVLKAANDPGAVMELIAQRSPAITTAAAMAVFLEESGELVCHAASSSAASLKGTRFPVAQTVSSNALRQHSIVRCEETEVDGRADAVACRGLGFHSMVIAPMISNGNLNGTLVSLSRSPNAFDDLDAYTTQLLAGLAATAVALALEFRERKASEERYRMLFERNVAGVFHSTADGRFLDCNSAFARYLGYESREELLALPSWNVYAERAEREMFLRRLRDEQSITSIRLRLKKKDGTPVTGLVNASLMTGEGGETQLLGTLVEE